MKSVNDTTATKPFLLKSRDAARLLAVSERTLWALTKQGEIPAVRRGRIVRYDVDDLQAWIRCRKDPGGVA